MVNREPLDRGIYWGEGAWGETRQRWQEEGMAPDHDFGFDPTTGVGININYAPSWDTGPIEDEGEHELAKGKDAIDRELDRIRPAYETGDYIPAADHSIPPDVSWENYVYYCQKRKEMVGLG